MNVANDSRRSSNHLLIVMFNGTPCSYVFIFTRGSLNNWFQAYIFLICYHHVLERSDVGDQDETERELSHIFRLTEICFWIKISNLKAVLCYCFINLLYWYHGKKLTKDEKLQKILRVFNFFLLPSSSTTQIMLSIFYVYFLLTEVPGVARGIWNKNWK